VLDVLAALRAQCRFGAAFMAAEFRAVNPPATQDQFATALQGISLSFEPHAEFKKRVPAALGLIRTGDTTQYANLVLESA
jgi:D-ribose pyranase